jgi:chromosome segregation ATPase
LNILAEKLAEANKRADTLAQKLEQSEKARKEAETDAKKAKADAEKAKADAAGVEDLRKRLHDAETSLSDKIAEQAAREEKILSRLEAQSRRFVSKYPTLCAFPRVTSHFASTLYL